jgi:superfamily II DNA/RNA helicase
MGFEPQIMRIIDNIRPERQTVMFSATFPRTVEAAARKILQQPLEIIVGARSVVSDGKFPPPTTRFEQFWTMPFALPKSCSLLGK